jgi:hypothetical protein
VHHRTATVHVWCAICFLFWRRRPLQIRGSWCTGHCPVHTRQSGAPYRPLARATRCPRIARSSVALAAVGSPNSPVNYSRTPPNSPDSGLFTEGWPGAPDTVRCTTGQSGVPRRAGLWLYQAKSFAFISFPVSSIWTQYVSTQNNVLSLETYLVT